MFVRHLFCGLIVFASVVFLYALDPEMTWGQRGKRTGQPNWGSTQDGWKLGLVFPKGVYGTNETVFGEAALRNETDSSRPLVTNSDGDGDYKITVLDERERIVPKQNEILAGFANLHNWHLAGHSDYWDTVLVSRWHNITAPGVYRIFISRRVAGTNGPGEITITSATNIIRVLNIGRTSTNGEPLNMIKPYL